MEGKEIGKGKGGREREEKGEGRKGEKGRCTYISVVGGQWSQGGRNKYTQLQGRHEGHLGPVTVYLSRFLQRVNKRKEQT
jgi:hypothetical protein